MWYMTRPDALKVLSDERAVKSLRRYFKVVQDSLPAKFTIARRIEANFDGEDSMDRLWRQHDEAYEKYIGLERDIDSGKLMLKEMDMPEKSFLDLKIRLTEKILESCTLCERMCKKNRWKGEVGSCQLGVDMHVSTSFFHMGEEPELVPSYTVFTVGCNLKCKHCQNWSISQRYEEGTKIGFEEIAYDVDRARVRGARNLNMVGGDPTPWLYNWLKVAKELDKSIPLVWNSNSYYSTESAGILQGIIDVYLLDFKYGRGICSTNISGAPSYWDASTRNHLYAMESGELIIRVLVLPGHLECCTKDILMWIGENLGQDTRVNIMWQFRPEWRAQEVPELQRRLTRKEMARSHEIAREVGLTNYIT